MKILKRRCIGLVLGGGGARGLAHIGVLKVLDEAGIPVDLIVGTSAGALVGAAYAGGIPPEEIARRAEAYILSTDFQSSAICAFEKAQCDEAAGVADKIRNYLKNHYYIVAAMFRPGVLPETDFRAAIDHFVPDIDIQDTRPPFRAVATDLVSGEEIVFDQGSLRQAVTASCAVPVAFPPIKDGERLLSDGGIISLIPCAVARKAGADVVIAVTVGADISTETELRTAVRISRRIEEIMAQRLENYELAEADIVIRPQVGDLHWSSFSQALELVTQGEQAAREKLEDIRGALPGVKKWFTWKQLFG